MKSKKLIYKTTYENISSIVEILHPTIEDIRDILLEINKGIVWGTTMPPYDITYEIREFEVNFRSVLKETRKDITFFYKYKYEIEDTETASYKKKIIGYRLGTDIQKVDIVSFFTKIKENSTEHRIYQIGGRYSNSSEFLDDFKKKADQDLQGYSSEQTLQYYEQIKDSSLFEEYDFSIKHHVLKTLEGLYYVNKKRAKSTKIFDEMMELNQFMMEDLEIEQIVEQEQVSLTEQEVQDKCNSTVKYFMDLVFVV